MTDRSSPISKTLFRILYAIISSARNLADLEKYEDMSIKLSQTRISVDEALKLAKEGKVVVDIDGAKQARSTWRGNPLRVSPFQRSLRSLPPFLGRGMDPRPATKGAYPLGSPDERFPAASRRAYSRSSKRENDPDVKAPSGFEHGLGVRPGEISVIKQVGDEPKETQGRTQYVIGLEVNETRSGNSDLSRA